MARRLDDEALRTRILDLIRAGHGRYEAAKVVQLSPATFSDYYRSVPSFRTEVEEAEAASVEPVLTVVRAEALDGDMRAAELYLKHKAPPPAGSKQTVEHVHVLDPAQIDEIAELQALLQQRPALPARKEVIDVEEVDPPGEVPGL